MADEKPWSALRANLYALISRNPKSNRTVVEWARLRREDHVLDIGCGPGAAVRLAGDTAMLAVGIDTSPAMVQVATRRADGRANVEFHVGAAEDLPFPDHAFTKVWSIHAYHHWASEDDGLAEAYRVLVPAGLLLIAERQGRGAHSMTESAGHALAERLGDVGFVDCDVSTSGKVIIVSAYRPADAA